MGLFNKKPDPISQRAKALNDQIAALEVQIKKLSEEKAQAAAPVQQNGPVPSRSKPSQPRLRSTALPHRQAMPAAATAPASPHEPIFEEIGQNRIKAPPEPATPGHFNELGVRKYDLSATWQRLKNHFRGPPTTNPKLVSYLAAGSIQGLRPLRYEKRVARNRFIVLVVILALVLWGLIAVFVSRK